MPDPEQHTVIHNPQKNRFELQLDSGLAELVYMKVGDTLIFHHTEVPEAAEGQGVGSQLAKAGLEFVKNEGISAAVMCPFVKAYIERHPEYQDVIKMRS